MCSPQLAAVGHKLWRNRTTLIGLTAVCAWLHVLAVAAWVPRFGFSPTAPIWGAAASAGVFVALLLAVVGLRATLARFGLTGWRPDREAVCDAIGAGVLLGAVSTDYTWVKLLVPAINGHLWDRQFGALDRALCLGVDPNRFLLAILEGNPRWIATALDGAYALWAPMALLGGLLLLTSPVVQVRCRAAVSIAALWLASAWLYVAFPALGPVLVDVDLWNEVRVIEPVAAMSQHVLLKNYLGVKSILGGTPVGVATAFGVAAMPSLHVAMDVLLALWARHQSRCLAWTWWLLAGVTSIGAVATGWHYLVDVIAGAALAAAVYGVAAVRREPIRR